MVMVEKTGEGSIVRLPAQFVQAVSQSFLASLRKEIANGAIRIIVDFKETDIIDSSAIGALVSIAKDARTRGASMYIRNLNKEIRELFLDTGLDKIFNVETDGKVQSAEVDIFEKSVDIRLDIKTELVDNVCILHLAGVMNHPQGSRFFKQQFLLAMAQYKKILLDLEELTFFDSLSVSVVLNMNKLIKETGGSMRLCGANYIVNDLFNTLNINQIIPIYNVVTDALGDWV
jgi:N-acetylglucosaminyldiphosphoundecaprenol N-acetyl-beta-D-mannosaminyltransferase